MIVIEIETGGDAFQTEVGQIDLNEVRRVLNQAGERLAGASYDGFRNLHDSNGNTCGLVKFV